MVVCVHTPLAEVTEIMGPSTAEVSTGNKGATHAASSNTPEKHCRLHTSTGSRSEMVVADLQVPSDSPWVLDWCVHAVNRRDTSLVVRLEALLFLGSFVKSYVFLARYAIINYNRRQCSR